MSCNWALLRAVRVTGMTKREPWPAFLTGLPVAERVRSRLHAWAWLREFLQVVGLGMGVADA